MLYALERGGIEDKIIEQCIRTRMPLPAAIANAPELEAGLGIFYLAFMELSSCRVLGMGEGPIPWSVIVQYAEVYDFTGELREDLFYHVRSLDLTYLRYRAEQRKAE